ncbi:hypothetical protein CFOL_v3_20031 [Cephalotus follicularis]|uniref:Uncharacterized protein n=1 Tax=Cephalotus follicularis TaxID=3775 RepID=A0A1Q3C8Y4_CEPFO|nr:hypothetical protein CFOL_v3_20031 [Cephalotus follicularis]
MIHTAAKLCRGLGPACRSSFLSPSSSSCSPFRSISCYGSNLYPVAAQMVDYALSHARSQNTDESYAQGMLVLEQCLSSQSSEEGIGQNSRGVVLLAMATLSYERGNFGEAIEKLQKVQDLKRSSLAYRVAAMEALVGLNLQLGQDDTSSVLANDFFKVVEENYSQAGSVIMGRAKALKGLVELVHGNLVSAESIFGGLHKSDRCAGSVALSYGEFLHATLNFSLAKELYQKVIDGVSDNWKCDDMDTIAVCNMTSEEVLLAATLALGQLEAHMGNFVGAEEMLTKALTKAEEHFGNRHPKVGAVVTCIALMYGQKAMVEHSSSLIVQEGLYRRALEILKAPQLEYEGSKINLDGGDVMALARGGYAELLCLQQNRKGEGEKMKRWAEAAWNSRRLSLAEALDFLEPSGKVAVVEARISRAL